MQMWACALCALETTELTTAWQVSDLQGVSCPAGLHWAAAAARLAANSLIIIPLTFDDKHITTNTQLIIIETSTSAVNRHTQPQAGPLGLAGIKSARRRPQQAPQQQERCKLPAASDSSSASPSQLAPAAGNMSVIAKITSKGRGDTLGTHLSAP